MPANSCGSTPTIVTGTPFMMTTLPTAFGLPPNRSRQYFALITATGGASALSSSGTIVRPRCALTPSIW